MAVEQTLREQAHQVFCNVLGLSVQLLHGFPLHYNAVSLSVCKDEADEDSKSAQCQEHDYKSRYSTYRSGSNTATLAQCTTPGPPRHFRCQPQSSPWCKRRQQSVSKFSQALPCSLSTLLHAWPCIMHINIPARSHENIKAKKGNRG